MQDCKVSEWGPWSPCSVRCGSGGITERHRVILHQASNGGNSCPHLTQGKACAGIACDEHEPEEKWAGKGCSKRTIFRKPTSETLFQGGSQVFQIGQVASD